VGRRNKEKGGEGKKKSRLSQGRNVERIGERGPRKGHKTGKKEKCPEGEGWGVGGDIEKGVFPCGVGQKREILTLRPRAKIRTE